MKDKFLHLYMDIATRVSQMSYDTKYKVGCVIVKDGNIIGFGWNGTPPGDPNECKDENGITKDEVIHAEMNAIAKAARAGISTSDADLFCTVSPCFTCAKLILQSGIKTVYYKIEYRMPQAIRFLIDHGIKVMAYSEELHSYVECK